MAVKGGYTIINLRDHSLSATATTILDDGSLYDRVEGSHQKAFLLTGINIGGTKHNDVYVNFKQSGSWFITVVYGYTITIDDSSDVTAVAVAA